MAICLRVHPYDRAVPFQPVGRRRHRPAADQVFFPRILRQRAFLLSLPKLRRTFPVTSSLSTAAATGERPLVNGKRAGARSRVMENDGAARPPASRVSVEKSPGLQAGRPTLRVFVTPSLTRSPSGLKNVRLRRSGGPESALPPRAIQLVVAEEARPGLVGLERIPLKTRALGPTVSTVDRAPTSRRAKAKRRWRPGYPQSPWRSGP